MVVKADTANAALWAVAATGEMGHDVNYIAIYGDIKPLTNEVWPDISPSLPD